MVFECNWEKIISNISQRMPACPLCIREHSAIVTNVILHFYLRLCLPWLFVSIRKRAVFFSNLNSQPRLFNEDDAQ